MMAYNRTMSLEQALKYFREADFAAALNACLKLEQDLHQADLYKIKELKARCLLELKQAQEASVIFEELELYSQAAYAAILNRDLERATRLYKEAEYSPARKWGEFLIAFLQSDDKLSIASPGYLTFRLYTEATIGYFLTYDLKDYFDKFLRHRNDLIQVYPETLKDIGSAYLARKEYQTALVLLEEAKSKFVHDTGVHFKSAMAYFALDMPEKAKPFLNTVAKMLPGSTLIQRLLKIH